MRHLSRCAVIVSVLGFQTWAIVPFADTRKERAWPFVPYPMYNAPHAYGERFGAASLIATPCAGGAPVVLGAADLGTSTHKHLWSLLGAAVDPKSSTARTRIISYADRIGAGKWCSFAVQYNWGTVTPHGIVRPAVPVVAARWTRQ